VGGKGVVSRCVWVGCCVVSVMAANCRGLCWRWGNALDEQVSTAQGGM
jgi:hypothetical protein